MLKLAPQAHQLEAAIDDHRVRDPRGAQRIVEPLRGGGRGVRRAEESEFARAGDARDPVQFGAVEEVLAVGDFHGVRVGRRGGRAVRRRRLRQCRHEHDLGPRLQHLAAVLRLPAQLHRHDEELVLLHGLTGIRSQCEGIVRVQLHRLRDPQLVEPVEDEPRMPVQRGVGEELDVQRDRQHRPTIEDVRTQDRMRFHVDRPIEDRDEVDVRSGVGRRDHGVRNRTGGGPRSGNGDCARAAAGAVLAQSEHLDGLARGVQFVNEKQPALDERDEADAFGFELLAQRGRDHAAFPRPPVDGDDAATGPLARFHLSRLVQDLVRRGISQLTGAAVARGDRTEEHQRLEIFLRKQIEQVAEPFDLRVVNAVEVACGKVLDAAVSQYAGSVNQCGDCAELHADLMQQVGHRLAVAHVDGEVRDLRTARFDPLQGAANLALGDDLLVLFADLPRPGFGSQLLGNRTLEFGFGGQPGQPIGFDSRRRRAAR